MNLNLDVGKILVGCLCITNDALYNLMEYITNNWESKLLSAILSTDLCKSFDTIYHKLLIIKIENYGSRSVATYFVQVILKIE